MEKVCELHKGRTTILNPSTTIMNNPEAQARKVGHPATRAAARGRSNSLDGSPNLQWRLSAAQLFNLLAVAPIVDEILGEFPLDPNPHAANNPIPPVNAAPIPEPDPEVPAAEQDPPNIPPPAAPIPPFPENLGPCGAHRLFP